MPSAARNARCLPLVRTATFLPFRNLLQEIGLPVDRLSQKWKLPASAMDDPEALLPLRSICQFLDEVVRREGVTDLGFQVGLRTPVASLGHFGFAIRHAVTLWDALHMAERLVSTLTSGSDIRIEKAGGTVWLHHRMLIGDTLGSRHADAFGLMMLVNLIRLAETDRWRPVAIRMPIAPDPVVADLELFQAAALRFNQATSAIAVPTMLLAKPLQQQSAHGLVDTDRLIDGLKLSAPAQDLCGSVKQFLQSQLPHGVTDIAATAEAAGLSVRTLQRQLRKEGSDYSRLLEQTRFRLAAELLRDSGIKIVDIALELGYGDSANFTRAFRRWAGISPQDFRCQDHGT